MYSNDLARETGRKLSYVLPAASNSAPSWKMLSEGVCLMFSEGVDSQIYTTALEGYTT